MKRLRFATSVFLVVLTLFSFSSSYAANPSKSPLDVLMSDEFYQDFFGVNALDLLDMGSDGRTLNLDFATDNEKPRVSLDEPFKVDCSQFSQYELIIDCEGMNAVGYVTLYLHSKAGWYSATGQVTRGGSNRYSILFNGNSFSTEDKPGGLDEVDAVRISFWRGKAIDSTLRIRSFKGLRRDFAAIEIDDHGRENHRITESFVRAMNRMGRPCDHLFDANLTKDSLSRYSVVALPIAGGISNETVDLICDYIDNGGFVVACYNIPTKILNKLGIKNEGYIKCSDAGIEIQGMTLNQKFLEDNGLNDETLPTLIRQNSWNFEVVSPIENWSSHRTTPPFMNGQARVVANWTLVSGEITKYPALILSPHGLYCSHIITEESVNEKRAVLDSVATVFSANVARDVLRREWLDIFQVGVAPEKNIDELRAETFSYLKKSLGEQGWSMEDVAELLVGANDSTLDVKKFGKLRTDLRRAYSARIDDFLASARFPKDQVRMWWEHSGCGIYPGDWERTMRELSEAGFNGVVPNLLWGGLAYYKSDVLPQASLVQRYGDQVELAVAAGKKYGVKVHAWMVCFNASNSTREFLDQMKAEGRLQKTLEGEEQPWLCPSNPENRALELAALEEVATKYDVDGIHFDYIRFPDDKTCFCDGCCKRFGEYYREKYGIELENFPACLSGASKVSDAWREWRCEQITTFVRSVNESVRAKRPDIQISAAVFPQYPGTKRSIGQDWGLWVEEGLLDFVCPMDYTSDPGYFKQLVESQTEVVQHKIPLYPGIGMTATGIAMKPHEVVLQAKIAQQLDSEGFIIFNLARSTAESALPAFKKGMDSQK